MGTCSYVLTGTAKGMAETFGSTCHGAGRAMSRARSRRQIAYTDVLAKLAAKGISIRVVRFGVLVGSRLKWTLEVTVETLASLCRRVRS